MSRILHRQSKSSVWERIPALSSGILLCLMVDSLLLVKKKKKKEKDLQMSSLNLHFDVDNDNIICLNLISQATCWRERRRKATGGWDWTLTLILKQPTKPSEWLKEWSTRCGSMLSTALACLVTVRPQSLSCQLVSLYQQVQTSSCLTCCIQLICSTACSCDGWRRWGWHVWWLWSCVTPGLASLQVSGTWMSCGHDGTGVMFVVCLS